MNDWRIVVAALVIFASGVITGGVTVRLSHSAVSRPPQMPPASTVAGEAPKPGAPRLGVAMNNQLARHETQLRDLMQRMNRRLDLSAQQRGRIEDLVAETQHRLQQWFRDLNPRTREELRGLHDRIRAELTTEQRVEYDRLTRFPHPTLDDHLAPEPERNPLNAGPQR